VRFRGREIFHPDIGREMLEQMAEELRDVATVEQRPLMEGRALSLMLAPSAKAIASAKPKQPREPKPQAANTAPAAASASQPPTPNEPDVDADADDATDDEEE
jgi:translation initiation factor IF-3